LRLSHILCAPLSLRHASYWLRRRLYYLTCLSRWVLRITFREGAGILGLSDEVDASPLPSEEECSQQIVSVFAAPPSLPDPSGAGPDKQTAAEIGALCAIDLVEYSMLAGVFDDALGLLLPAFKRAEASGRVTSYVLSRVAVVPLVC